MLEKALRSLFPIIFIPIIIIGITLTILVLELVKLMRSLQACLCKKYGKPFPFIKGLYCVWMLTDDVRARSVDMEVISILSRKTYPRGKHEWMNGMWQTIFLIGVEELILQFPDLISLQLRI